MAFAPLPHASLRRSVESFAERVLPKLRQAVSHQPTAAAAQLEAV